MARIVAERPDIGRTPEASRSRECMDGSDDQRSCARDLLRHIPRVNSAVERRDSETR